MLYLLLLSGKVYGQYHVETLVPLQSQRLSNIKPESDQRQEALEDHDHLLPEEMCHIH